MARTYSFGTETYSRKKDGNAFLTEHFQVKEFACKDGDDEIVICPELLLHCLEPLFTLMKAKAINITSGYRTVTHSLAVGGKGELDNHHMGMAADIKVKKQDGTYYSSKEVCCALEDMGWNHGIGYMATAVHVDTGSKCWFDETKNNVTTTSWRAKFGMANTVSQTPQNTSVIASKIDFTPTYKVRKTANGYATEKKIYKGNTFKVYDTKGDWYRIGVNQWIKAKNYSIKVK